MTSGQRINDAILSAIRKERRIDPYIRPAFDRVLRPPLAALTQAAIRARRPPAAIGLAQERHIDGEDDAAVAIAQCMSEFLHKTYDDARPAQRAGNTKTYGVVRGTLQVLPNLAPHLRKGLFTEPVAYPAWVRFAGPGPLAPPDLDDNGVLSIGIKVMRVPGLKLLDERSTQDFTGISAPTFTTATVIDNLNLQRHILNGTPVLHFLGPRHHHMLDGVMQALYAKTQLNPLIERYWSCSSYLYGAGQAMHYSIAPASNLSCRFPRRPSANYLQEAMVATLRTQSVSFHFMVQLQTDTSRMPIEDDGVEWPERLSPFECVARLHLPAQRFDSEAQLAFADNLSFNPWHCIVDHRPLGNQNRARRVIYQRLSELRQSMNGSRHIEPTGDERFEDATTFTTDVEPDEFVSRRKTASAHDANGGNDE
jgi:hypothetical protein